MDSDSEVLMKEYTKMMTDMILLCATLALSLFFWVISLTISTYYGESVSFLSRQGNVKGAVRANINPFF